MNKDLGFTAADRVENIRRVAEIARLLADAGLIVIVSLISPFIRERAMARQLAGDIDFLEVFVDTPLAICEARDPKHLYAKARAGAILNFTGVNAPYEPPPMADLTLLTANVSPELLGRATDRSVAAARHTSATVRSLPARAIYVRSGYRLESLRNFKRTQSGGVR